MPDQVKVVAGQRGKSSPLRKATVINDLMDMLAAYKATALGQPGVASSLNFPTDIVKVRNVTGADLPRGTCLQLGDLLLDELDPRNPWFEADYPEGEYPDGRLGRCVLLRRALKDDEIGEAQASGVCIARVYVTSESHTFGIPQAGSGLLQSDTIGPIEFLSPLDELELDEEEAPISAEQEAFVRIGQSISDQGPLRIQLEENFGDTAASRAFGHFCIGNPSDETLSNFGGAIFHDPMGIFSGGNNSYGWAVWMQDAKRWEIIQLACQ